MAATDDSQQQQTNNNHCTLDLLALILPSRHRHLHLHRLLLPSFPPVLYSSSSSSNNCTFFFCFCFFFAIASAPPSPNQPTHLLHNSRALIRRHAQTPNPLLYIPTLPSRSLPLLRLSFSCARSLPPLRRPCTDPTKLHPNLSQTRRPLPLGPRCPVFLPYLLH